LRHRSTPGLLLSEGRGPEWDPIPATPSCFCYRMSFVAPGGTVKCSTRRTGGIPARGQDALKNPFRSSLATSSTRYILPSRFKHHFFALSPTSTRRAAHPTTPWFLRRQRAPTLCWQTTQADPCRMEVVYAMSPCALRQPAEPWGPASERFDERPIGPEMDTCRLSRPANRGTKVVQRSALRTRVDPRQVAHSSCRFHVWHPIVTLVRQSVVCCASKQWPRSLPGVPVPSPGRDGVGWWCRVDVHHDASLRSRRFDNANGFFFFFYVGRSGTKHGRCLQYRLILSSTISIVFSITARPCSGRRRAFLPPRNGSQCLSVLPGGVTPPAIAASVGDTS
jgi:hypothetical protein